MSFPFGGHPTLGKYIQWVRDQGFEAHTGIATDSSGKAHTVTKIFKPGGPSVVVAGTLQNEYLTPTQVANLDRRLKVKSPFFSTDDR